MEAVIHDPLILSEHVVILEVYHYQRRSIPLISSQTKNLMAIIIYYIIYNYIYIYIYIYIHYAHLKDIIILINLKLPFLAKVGYMCMHDYHLPSRNDVDENPLLSTDNFRNII